MFGIYPKKGKHILASIMFAQNDISNAVLVAIQKFLGIGKISIQSKTNSSRLSLDGVVNAKIFIDLVEKEEAEFFGMKALDYLEFKEAVAILNDKLHLTADGQGRTQIINIIEKMRINKLQNEIKKEVTPPHHTDGPHTVRGNGTTRVGPL
jgi:hypothetical protein